MIARPLSRANRKDWHQIHDYSITQITYHTADGREANDLRGHSRSQFNCRVTAGGGQSGQCWAEDPSGGVKARGLEGSLEVPWPGIELSCVRKQRGQLVAW